MISVCPYCLGQHEDLCPRISAIDYNEDGSTVKRVEFFRQAAPVEIHLSPESDESLRKRLLPIVRGTCNEEKLATATGKRLDEIAGWYAEGRRGVQ